MHRLREVAGGGLVAACGVELRADELEAMADHVATTPIEVFGFTTRGERVSCEKCKEAAADGT